MKNTQNILLGFLSGFALYLVGSIALFLPYCNISDPSFSVAMFASLLLGAGISFSAIILKNRSLKQAALRFLIILISYFGLVILNGSIGTIPFLMSKLNLLDSSAASNISGMITLLFIVVFFTAALLAILALAGMRIFKKVFLQIRHNRKYK